MKDDKYPEFLPIHCVIHREHLAAKYLKYYHVMKTVFEIVNFIIYRATSRRQVRNFAEKLDLYVIQKDINYYCIVKWLSTSNVLKRFVDVFEPICSFFGKRGMNYEQLGDIEWDVDVIFFTHVMNHLQVLSLSLQLKDMIASDLVKTIFSFQNKIKLFQRDKKFYLQPILCLKNLSILKIICVHER